MRKTFLAIAGLLLAMLCGCGQGQKPGRATQTGQAAATGKSGSTTAPAKPSRPRAHLHVPLSAEFQNIISLGSVNIVYTQGDAYSIELEGDSALLRHVNADIECNVLTLAIQGEGDKDVNLYETNYGVTARITTPGLQVVSLCESGSFTCEGRWAVPNVHIGCMSTGSFDVADLQCETFRYESTGSDRSAFRQLQAQTVALFAYRDCQSAFRVDCDRLEVDASGESRLDLTGRAGSKAISHRGKSVINDKTTAQ